MKKEESDMLHVYDVCFKIGQIRLQDNLLRALLGKEVP